MNPIRNKNYSQYNKISNGVNTGKGKIVKEKTQEIERQ